MIERARNSQRMSKNISQRPYHAECTSSRPITEVKQHWALLVLGWETAWEHRVLLAFCFFSISRLCSKKYKFWRIHKVIWWCFIVTKNKLADLKKSQNFSISRVWSKKYKFRRIFVILAISQIYLVKKKNFTSAREKTTWFGDFDQNFFISPRHLGFFHNVKKSWEKKTRRSQQLALRYMWRKREKRRQAAQCRRLSATVVCSLSV